MDYYKIINLNKEPFSNSPDPDFFYGSRQHLDCLQKLELSLRLRRGLNVIIGDVGTGKTTLCRQLIRRFSEDENFETHLILDPHFTHSTEFLVTVAKMFKKSKPPANTNDWQLKEAIKQYLFKQGVENNRTVTLIVDEGQKLPLFCLELLREFLNYETNEYKLLQIVIFAQNEFEKTVLECANFADRINLYHYLKPMSFRDTRQMIRYRLEKSSNDFKTYTFFSFTALLAIYWATRGYPRKIINLCHRCVLTMIIQNRSVVDLFLVRTCIPRVFPNRTRRSKKTALALGIPAVIIIAAVSVIHFTPIRLGQWFDFGGFGPQLRAASTAETQPVPPPETPPLQRAPAAPPTGTGETAEAAAQIAAAAERSAEPAPEQPEKPAVPAPLPVPQETLPPTDADALGRVTIIRNETLSGLIQNVYGDFNSKYFKSLILANPHIEDPDVVRVGQSVLMPAIPVEVAALPPEGWWVRVGQVDSLEAAYRLQKTLPRSVPPVRMIPFRNPREGTQFALVLARCFSSRAAASRRLNQLPPELRGTAELVSDWPADSVFYSDPYFGRGSPG
jgi:general secretion pathway protein A